MKEFLFTQQNYKKASILYLMSFCVGEGLFFAEGEKWKAHRRVISTCFHYDFLTKKIQMIQETTREFLDKISPSEYKNCLIMDRLQEITGEVVGRIFFGRNLNKYSFEGKPLTLALANLMSDMGKLTLSPTYLALGATPFFPLVSRLPRFTKFMKRVQDFRVECKKIIQDRKAESQRYDDILDALIAQQQQETNRENKYFTDEDITNEFVTFFMAGMDTTGHLVTMVLYNLTQYPEYLQKLKEERDMTYNAEQNVKVETLQNMNVFILKNDKYASSFKKTINISKKSRH